MIRLQELETGKWAAATAGRMDRREGGNSYVDGKNDYLMNSNEKKELHMFYMLKSFLCKKCKLNYITLGRV